MSEDLKCAACGKPATVLTLGACSECSQYPPYTKRVYEVNETPRSTIITLSLKPEVNN